MNIVQFLFGQGVKTSISGYVVAAAIAILPIMQGNTWTWRDLIVPTMIAILGRFTKLNADIKKED